MKRLLASSNKTNFKELNKSKIFDFFLSLTIFITFFITLFVDKKDKTYIVLLPILFTVLSIFLLIIKRKSISFTTYVILLIMYFRYMILPLTIFSSNSLSSYSMNYDNIKSAVFLMSYEMIAIFVVLIFFYSKPKKTNVEFAYRNNVNFASIPLLLFFILVAVVLYVLSPDLVGSIDILLTGGKSSSGNDVYGLFKILWEVSIFFIYTILCALLTKKKSTFRLLLVVAVSYLFVLVLMLGSQTVSRWTLVTFTVTAFLYTADLFPQKKGIVLIMYSIPAIFLLVYLSIAKNLGSATISAGFLNKLFSSSLLDIYFAGIVNVNNSISLKNTYDVSILNLIPDIFKNFPLISHYINASSTTTYLYNRTVYGSLNANDQILPLIGQSSIYFGYLFSPILSVVSVILCLHFENKAKASIGIIKILFYSLSIWLTFSPILNMTIILSWCYQRFIPYFVTLWILKIFSRSLNTNRGSLNVGYATK